MNQLYIDGLMLGNWWINFISKDRCWEIAESTLYRRTDVGKLANQLYIQGKNGTRFNLVYLVSGTRFWAENFVVLGFFGTMFSKASTSFSPEIFGTRFKKHGGSFKNTH